MRKEKDNRERAAQYASQGDREAGHCLGLTEAYGSVTFRAAIFFARSLIVREFLPLAGPETAPPSESKI